jgi:hypothetical protein
MHRFFGDGDDGDLHGARQGNFPVQQLLECLR